MYAERDLAAHIRVAQIIVRLKEKPNKFKKTEQQPGMHKRAECIYPHFGAACAQFEHGAFATGEELPHMQSLRSAASPIPDGSSRRDHLYLGN